MRKHFNLPKCLGLEWHLADFVCFCNQLSILKWGPVLLRGLPILVSIFLRIHHTVSHKWLSLTFLLCSFGIFWGFVGSFLKLPILSRNDAYVTRTWFEWVHLGRLTTFLCSSIWTFLRLCWCKLSVFKVICILVAWFRIAAIVSH